MAEAIMIHMHFGSPFIGVGENPLQLGDLVLFQSRFPLSRGGKKEVQDQKTSHFAKWL